MNLEQQEKNSKLPFDFMVLFPTGHPEKFHPACDETYFLAYMFGRTDGLENRVILSHCRANLSAFTFQLLDPCRMLTYFPRLPVTMMTMSPETNVSYHLNEKQTTMYILNIIICVHPNEFGN